MATYAVADLHGNGILWDKIKKYLRDDDKCYILGDLIDRGPDGFRMMKEALSDPRFIYLMGNHEAMFANAIAFYPQVTDNFILHMSNGGRATWVNWELSGADKSYVKKLRKLRKTAIYESPEGYKFLLSHSGWDLNKTLDGKECDTLWNRDHMDTPTVAAIPSEYVMIHGHTPIQCYTKEFGAYFYDDGLKINIDMGGKAVCLFNLDTFDEVMFYEKEN